MKNRNLCLIMGLLANVATLHQSLGVEGCEDSDGGWQEHTVGDITLHRIKTQIRGVVAQEEPKNVKYVLELCADTEINTQMECNDRKVYLPTDDSELLYQMMDIAKLALASDAYVTVDVDRDFGVESVDNCELPRVLSLSILSKIE